MRTPDNYTHEQMMVDHWETVAAVFGDDYLPVTDAEQLDDEEKAQIESVVDAPDDAAVDDV